MAARKRSGREPQRVRRRTKPTLSEAPIRVTIATVPQSVPHSTDDRRRVLEQDTILTKAALLYADEVELASLGVSMFSELQNIIDAGELGGFGLLASRDDETVARMLRDQGGTLPRNWRKQLDAALRVDPDRLESMGMDASALRDLREAAALHGDEMQRSIADLLEQHGATELIAAIKAGAVKLPQLNLSPASPLRPKSFDPDSSTDVRLWNWVEVLIDRITDRRTQMLFDRQAGELIQSMFTKGLLPANPPGRRLAAQAALGAGFVERLPAFPTAKMDELIDLKGDLALPLARYRGAVVRFSKDIANDLGTDLAFEVDQLWRETVHPTLLDLGDQMADHGLIREIARSLNVEDIRNFGEWTAGTYVAVAHATDLDALTTGLIATAAGGAATVALDAMRARKAGQAAGKTSEFYYLYQANRRLT